MENWGEGESGTPMEERKRRIGNTFNVRVSGEGTVEGINGSERSKKEGRVEKVRGAVCALPAQQTQMKEEKKEKKTQHYRVIVIGKRVIESE